MRTELAGSRKYVLSFYCFNPHPLLLASSTPRNSIMSINTPIKDKIESFMFHLKVRNPPKLLEEESLRKPHV